MEALIEEFLSVSSGDGDGDGYGYGSGYGDGSGYGFGYGSGVKEFNGCTVYMIDGIQTLLYRIHGAQIARGAILNGDLTETPCYIAKQGSSFAHGATLREAMNAALDKAFDDMPVEARLAAFCKEHEPGKLYQNRDFFSWHHRLTGSCEMGRRQFAREHGIDVEDGTMTPEEFIRLTESAYRGDVIRMLKPFYPEA